MGAPPRFSELGSLELSQYADWSELSRTMAPLYAKAAVLKPGSPLEAEVAKIKAESSDPKARATAALRLVEDQTRYVFLGMNDGGLVPAQADDTWARRFGDCKGKTALLTALLRALGIDAEPALVSTVFGDGLDQRLPMASWFDHVIVRARIEGKTYWLDGTRVGDRNIDDLVVPSFRWALPVQADGATLVRLDPDPLTLPNTEELMRIDASKGAATPAPTHIEITYRGESAAASRQQIASLPRSDYERYLREFWTKAYPWLGVSSVSTSDDPQANVVRLTADGASTLEWTLSPDGARLYRVPYTAMGVEVSFKREPGAHQDAPFAVTYPFFERRTKEIVLPGDGDFTLSGADVDQTVAGQILHRRSSIENGVLTIELSTHAMEQEFPATEADGDARALRDLAKSDVAVLYKVRSGTALASTAAAPVSGDLAAAERGDAAAQFRAALMYGHGSGVPINPTMALYWLTKSANGGYPPAQTAIGEAYLSGVGEPKDLAQAQVWMRKAAAQNDPGGQAALAYLYTAGLGVVRDDEQALDWAQKSANQGFAAGEDMLAQIYARRGHAGDAALAASWYGKAADQGLADAQVKLAIVYIRGMGVVRDPIRAVQLARKAADANDPTGELLLSDFYQHGVGVKQDSDMAMTLLRKAAGQGNVLAERMLGQAYLSGNGAVADKDQAMAWFGKAAAGGDLYSQQTLTALQGGAPPPPPPLPIPPAPGH
jgi:TPR repeat protein